MFKSTLRPLARAGAGARAYSTSRPATSSMARNVILGGSALATVSYLVSQRQAVRLDSESKSKNVPRESVLDSSSLKEPIHRRDGQYSCPAPALSFPLPLLVYGGSIANWSGGEKARSDAPSVVQQKTVEAEESQQGPQGAFNEETGEINWDCPVRPVPSSLLCFACATALY